MRRDLPWSVVAGALATACASGASNSRTVLRDSTDATFTLDCMSDGHCALTALDGTAPPLGCGDGSAAFKLEWRRFLDVCSASVHSGGPAAWSTTDSLCRMVVCDKDGDCPHTAGLDFICVHRLCEQPGSTGNLVLPSESLQLCLFGVPRPATCADATSSPNLRQAQNLVAASCPSANPSTPSCTVPSSCAQP
jgi:hypothetical protein